MYFGELIWRPFGGSIGFYVNSIATIFGGLNPDDYITISLPTKPIDGKITWLYGKESLGPIVGETIISRAKVSMSGNIFFIAPNSIIRRLYGEDNKIKGSVIECHVIKYNVPRFYLVQGETQEITFDSIREKVTI